MVYCHQKEWPSAQAFIAQHKFNLRGDYVSDYCGFDTLFYACKEGDAQTVYDMITCIPKLNLNYVNKKSGHTALWWAILNRYHDITKMLLEAGADPNADNMSATCLSFAMKWGDSEILGLLMNNGANYHTKEDIEFGDDRVALSQCLCNHCGSKDLIIDPRHGSRLALRNEDVRPMGTRRLPSSYNAPWAERVTDPNGAVIIEPTPYDYGGKRDQYLSENPPSNPPA